MASHTATTDDVDTVAVTGGNGTIGQAAIDYLGDRGYRTVNLNRGKRDEAGADQYVQVDLTDAGEVYGALRMADPDAVVHLGMIPTPDSTPGYRTFESNATSSYLVLEAAEGFGVDTVVLASSLSALGAGFEPGPVDLDYLPVDEAHPLSPSTPYGIGKQVLEVVADGVARREDVGTVASIRFPWVTDEAAMRETFAQSDRTIDAIRAAGDFHTARNTLFSYLAIDDAARLIEAAVEADFEGHERFFAAAPDTGTETPTPDLLDRVYPDVAVRRELSGHESLIDTSTAEELLGWEPVGSWRDL